MARLEALKSWVCGIGAASLLVAGTALADGRGGGFHGGPGHGFGGHAGYGYHGGYGYRGGYGWRGGYWGGCCGWGWGWAGLGLGLYVASLPLYYSTLWWEGVPYYYADNVYYRYDGAVGQYMTVAPPPSQAASAPATPASGTSSVGTDVMAYPKNGQSADQQGKDKFECHRWAVGQTGFDPTQGAAATNTAKRGDYMRAQAACLDGRGYSVR